MYRRGPSETTVLFSCCLLCLVRKVEKPNYVRRERYEGELRRTISLPTQIDPEKVQATYEHGVLKLEVPKVEAAKPKQISVKVK